MAFEILYLTGLLALIVFVFKWLFLGNKANSSPPTTKDEAERQPER
jgi:hypothetical protein